MRTDRILELMARKMGKSATPDELNELERLLEEYPEYHFMETATQSLESDTAHREKALEEEEVISDGWKQLAGRLRISESYSGDKYIPKTGKRKFFQAAAAILLVILAFAGGIFLRQDKDKKIKKVVATHVFKTPQGTTSGIVLPDGTKVWLNAASKLSYEAAFGKEQRIVHLAGEAFFEVAKDADHPFIVKATAITITVLGTSFNVKAYSEDDHVETTLINGKIQVQLNNEPEKKILLSPSEKLTVINNPETGKLKELPVRSNELKYQVQKILPLNAIDSSDVAETAWKDNKWAFQNEPFEEVAKKMERWYRVKIQFENTSLRQEELTGIFEKEDLQQALHLLQMTTPFRSRIVGDTVYLDQ